MVKHDENVQVEFSPISQNSRAVLCRMDDPQKVTYVFHKSFISSTFSYQQKNMQRSHPLRYVQKEMGFSLSFKASFSQSRNLWIQGFSLGQHALMKHMTWMKCKA